MRTRILLDLAVVLLAATPSPLAAETDWVSRRVEPSSPLLTDTSAAVAITPEGQHVLFHSTARDLGADVPELAGSQVYLWDGRTGTNRIVSHRHGVPTGGCVGVSVGIALSDDGRYALFQSTCNDLSGEFAAAQLGSPQLWLWDRDADRTLLVTHSWRAAERGTDGFGIVAGMDRAGDYVVFESSAADLVRGVNDPEGHRDIFLWERESGRSRLVSRRFVGGPRPANTDSSWPRISGDGGHVIFVSAATDLVAGFRSPFPGVGNVYRWSRESETIELVSHMPGEPTTGADGWCDTRGISDDGSIVAFSSSGSSLIEGGLDQNFTVDLFLWDVSNGEVTLASRRSGTEAVAADAVSYVSSLSANGQCLVFQSLASDLVAGDVAAGLGANVYVFDRPSATVELISRRFGSTAESLPGVHAPSGVSADCRRIAFTSDSNHLTPDGYDTTTFSDAFVWDRSWNRVWAVSRNASGTAPGALASFSGPLASSGDHLLFESFAPDLVSPPAVPGQNVFRGQIPLFFDDFELGDLENWGTPTKSTEAPRRRSGQRGRDR